MKISNKSFYFQLHPSHFEIAQRAQSEYPSSLQYRLAIYKGTQKCYAMNHNVQGKPIDNKIMFSGTILPFYLPIYSPNRKIEFILKAYKTQQENEVEIGHYLIKVNDLVKKYQEETEKHHTATVAINQNVSLTFEMFIEQTKQAVEELVKTYAIENAEITTKKEKRPRKIVTKSQLHQSVSELSEISDISPKRKIQRKPAEKRLRKQSSFKGDEEIGERSGFKYKRQDPQIKLYQSERDIFSPLQVKTTANQNNGRDETQSRHSALSERYNNGDQFVLKDGEEQIFFKESLRFEQLGKEQLEKDPSFKNETVNSYRTFTRSSCKSFGANQRKIRNPDLLRKIPHTEVDPSLKKDALRWQIMKERIFYVSFTILAVLLLLNALIPRRKV